MKYKVIFFNWLLPLLILLITTLLGIIFGSAGLVWQDFNSDIVLTLRLQRAAASAVVGSSLALAGLTLQAVLRNSLAEPFTLGISGGASVGAALAFVLELHLLSYYIVPAMAWIGALIMLAAVLLTGGRKGVENLLLSGVIAGTAASGVLMYLVSCADNDELAGVTWWMLGDLQAVDPVLLYPALAATLIACVVLHCFGRELNALALGSNVAWSIGVPPGFYTVFFIIIGSLLAAQTVALAGMIAFAGLIVPHLIRRFYGCDHRKIVIPAALWGGVFMQICDLLSRLLNPTRELPVGVLTAVVGGAMFLYVLNKSRESWR
ncbi:MAG: iron ABC transporter permease [Lentisphaerae bacterium]|nr:iron ABC transporter permease [Lentisphaerota bacterium]